MMFLDLPVIRVVALANYSFVDGRELRGRNLAGCGSVGSPSLGSLVEGVGGGEVEGANPQK